MKATDAYREINESPVKGIILYYTEKILSNLPNVMLNDVISKIQTGKTPPKSQSKYYEIEEIDWFKPSDIGHGIYLEEAERFAQVAVTEKKATIYPKNTLLMIGIGGGVGRVSILRNEGSSNQQITGITFKSFIYPEWAYYYYLVREDYVKSQAKSMSFPILNQDKIKSLDFKFPTYEEQVEFCNFLNHVWKCFKSGQVPELEYFDISEELKEYTLKQFKIITLNNNIHLNAKARKSLLTQLKQAILQEAIEGKLTAAWREQNPDVEPASELLKRIKAKKDQLIKERKIKKEKPLPFISEAEIPFALPGKAGFGVGWVKFYYLQMQEKAQIAKKDPLLIMNGVS